MTFKVSRKMTTWFLGGIMTTNSPGREELIKRLTRRANEMKFETEDDWWSWIRRRAMLLQVDESCTDQVYDLARDLLVDSVFHRVKEDRPMDIEQMVRRAIATAKETLNLVNTPMRLW